MIAEAILAREDRPLRLSWLHSWLESRRVALD